MDERPDDCGEDLDQSVPKEGTRNMMATRWAASRAACIGLGIGALLLPMPGESLALAADGPPDPNVIPGEQLDPASYGESFVEDMAAVLERERNRPKVKFNPRARNGAQGVWMVPSDRSTFNPKGKHNVVNTWGDTRMGIGFPEPVTVKGALIAGQAAAGVWPPAIKAVGYFNGEIVQTTEWFDQINADGAFFEMNLEHVDRVEIVAIPVINGGAWYGLDDLTFTTLARNETTVIDFEDLHYDKQLTGTAYKGLTWETGTGDFDSVEAMPPPAEPDGFDPDAGFDGDEGNLNEGGVALGGSALPELVQDFQGVIRGDNGQFSFPPDTCGAVGESHFIEVVNTNYRVWGKANGNLVASSSLSSFLPGASGDPRVVWDPHAERWIVMATNFNNAIQIAVSTTSSATGSWFKTSFIASTGSDTGCFPDYPTLGVDEDGIYIGAFMAGCGMTVFALEKAPMIDATPSLGVITAFRNLPFEGAIQPCVTYGDSGGQYFISRQDGNDLRLRQLTGPITSPNLVTRPSISIPSHGSPPDVPALGSSTPLDSVGTRLMNAIYRDGFIYTAHTIGISSRAACRWYQCDPLAGTSQSDTISDSSLNYFFPSIAVNSRGDVALGFSGADSSQFVAAYYTGRDANDAGMGTAPPALLRTGDAAQNNIDNFGRNRWGDYSLTSVDPVDDSLWTVQAYGHATNIWGTWIAQMSYTPAPTNDNCADAPLLFDGAVAFDTTFASKDDSISDTGCADMEADVWYRYVAQCDGEITISVCDADYDSVLAVYQGCPDGDDQAIFCNDDACGNASEITFNGSAGLYHIRIGGKTVADQGSGMLVTTCVPIVSECDGDFDDSGVVGVPDLLALLAVWGGNGAGADLAEPLDVVDTSDLLTLLSLWGDCP